MLPHTPDMTRKGNYSKSRCNILGKTRLATPPNSHEEAAIAS